MLESSFFLNKKVLITGNTGFKGSWLSVWLNLLGAIIYGLALCLIDLNVQMAFFTLI